MGRRKSRGKRIDWHDDSEVMEQLISPPIFNASQCSHIKINSEDEFIENTVEKSDKNTLIFLLINAKSPYFKYLSQNPCLTIKMCERFMDKIVWDLASANLSIKFSDIYETLYLSKYENKTGKISLPWNPYILTSRPDFDIKAILKWPNANWDWAYIARKFDVDLLHKLGDLIKYHLPIEHLVRFNVSFYEKLNLSDYLNRREYIRFDNSKFSIKIAYNLSNIQNINANLCVRNITNENFNKDLLRNNKSLFARMKGLDPEIIVEIFVELWNKNDWHNASCSLDLATIQILRHLPSWNWATIQTRFDLTFAFINDNFHLIKWNNKFNERAKFSDVLKYPHLPWDWKFLTRRRNMTPEFIKYFMKKNPKWDWDMSILSSLNLPLDIIEENLFLNWNWGLLSKNTAITSAFIEKYSKNLDWAELSKNPHIDIEFIRKTIGKYPWKYDLLSLRRDITPIVEQFPDIQWNFEHLSKCADMNFVKNNPNLTWNPVILSLRHDLDLTLIEEWKHKKWVFRYISYNSFIDTTFVMKYYKRLNKLALCKNPYKYHEFQYRVKIAKILEYKINLYIYKDLYNLIPKILSFI